MVVDLGDEGDLQLDAGQELAGAVAEAEADGVAQGRAAAQRDLQVAAADDLVADDLGVLDEEQRFLVGLVDEIRVLMASAGL